MRLRLGCLTFPNPCRILFRGVRWLPRPCPNGDVFIVDDVVRDERGDGGARVPGARIGPPEPI